MAKFPFKNVLEGTKHFWTKSQGPDAEGAAVTANPLTIGYKNASGNATGVTPTEALPVGDATAQAKLADILTKLSADPATQTTLAQILAKIIAAPATEAKQDTIIGHVDGVEGTLTALNGKDFATQTTLAAILNKIIAAPATEAKQTALNALIGEVQAAPTANTLLARLKSLEDKIDKITNGTTPAVTQLSGSNMEQVKLITSHSIPGPSIPTQGVYIGTNYKTAVSSTLAEFQVLNRSAYRVVGLYIKNDTDIGIRIRARLQFHTTAGIPSLAVGYVFKDANPLAAGAELYLFFHEDSTKGVPELRNYLLPGLDIFANGFAIPTTGTLEVKFFGGVL